MRKQTSLDLMMIEKLYGVGVDTPADIITEINERKHASCIEHEANIWF